MPRDCRDDPMDGPPSIQRQQIVDALGAVIREPTVTRDDRPDLDDPNATIRRKAVRRVQGWRRVWTIDSLHRICPSEITEHHVAAASRFVDDHQRREGAIVSRGNGGSDMGPEDVRVAAAINCEAARAAIGTSAYWYVFRACVLNWTVTDLALKADTRRDKVHGHLAAGLERLREHYDDMRPRRTFVPIAAPPAPDPPDTGLPAERSGRWKREKVSA